MTLPTRLLAAIDRAVEEAGGDATDARDLAAVWARVVDDTARRAAAIRSAVGRRRCSCRDGGEVGCGRCLRCHGRLT